VIPISVSQALTETLDERAVECSPAEATSGGQQVNNVTGTITTVDMREELT
jgi:hypothetical protein